MRASPEGLSLRPMDFTDLDNVALMDARAYPYSWSRNVFADCLRAGYLSRVLLSNGGIIGYGVISVAAGEAHVLNVCIEPQLQGRGLGGWLMERLMLLAQQHGARSVFLEVRPTNLPAIQLYDRLGFNEIGRRPNYYPADRGRREDALVMGKELLDGQPVPPT